MNSDGSCTALLIVVLYMLVAALGVVVVTLCRIVMTERRKHKLLARWVDKLNDELAISRIQRQQSEQSVRHGPHFLREGGVN